MSKTVKKTIARESDNAYFLKILIYFLFGMTWIKINGYMVIPAGLILGVLIVQHDHFSIDRKIEYAILIASAIFGYLGAIHLLSIWWQ